MKELKNPLRLRTVTVKTANRLNEIEDLICQGKVRSQIIEVMMNKHHISLSSVDRLIKLSKEQISMLLRVDSDILLEDTVHKLHALYRAALDNGDYKAAFSILSERSKLMKVGERVQAAAPSDSKTAKITDTVSSMIKKAKAPIL